jgi:hypothetical protein
MSDSPLGHDVRTLEQKTAGGEPAVYYCRLCFTCGQGTPLCDTKEAAGDEDIEHLDPATKEPVAG